MQWRRARKPSSCAAFEAAASPPFYLLGKPSTNDDNGKGTTAVTTINSTQRTSRSEGCTRNHAFFPLTPHSQHTSQHTHTGRLLFVEFNPWRAGAGAAIASQECVTNACMRRHHAGSNIGSKQCSARRQMSLSRPSFTGGEREFSSPTTSFRKVTKQLRPSCVPPGSITSSKRSPPFSS